MMTESQRPQRLRRVQEVRRPGRPDRWVHPEWELQLPWLVQGTTGRTVSAETLEPASGSPMDDPPPDFALFRDDEPTGESAQWLNLGRAVDLSTVVRARQVHGRTVSVHEKLDILTEIGAGRRGGTPPELIIAPDADGHSTSALGVLLGVTVADCIPVFLVDPTRRALAVLHAGWRGVAAGILEAGLGCLVQHFGSRPRELLVHLGPAICGACYEVGPEVHEALGLSDPGEPRPVDLREILGWRALAAGVAEKHLSLSGFCTRCAGSPFYSHRGGDRERQVGYLGIRAAS